MDILTVLGFAMMHRVTGYIPVDSGEPLYYASRVVAPTETKGAFVTVPSNAQFIQYSSTVKDSDRYRSKHDGKIVPIMLSDASVQGSISSGTLLAISHSFEDGRKGMDFIIWGYAIPAGQVVYSFDKFKAVDRGTSSIVKDRDGTWQLFIVKTSGVKNDVKKPTGDRK